MVVRPHARIGVPNVKEIDGSYAGQLEKKLLVCIDEAEISQITKLKLTERLTTYARKDPFPCELV